MTQKITCQIKFVGVRFEFVKKVKDHVFYNEHCLDRYAPMEPPEYKRFDLDIKQALAWKRLETGTHTP